MTGNNLNFSQRFIDALNLSLEVHGEDVRKGTSIPYMAHLLSVCSLVLYDGGSEVEAIAALLHDTLEDHPEKVNPEILTNRFGPKVLTIVQACSDTPPEYQGGQKPPWKERKERKEKYLKHLKNLFLGLSKKSDTSGERKKKAAQVLRVSLADKLDNVRSMVSDYRKAIHKSSESGDSFWSRFNAGKEQQYWYLESLLNVYTMGHESLGTSDFLLEEFQRSVAELKALAKV